MFDYKYTTKIISSSLESLKDILDDFGDLHSELTNEAWEVNETKDAIQLSLDLPGIDKTTLDICVQENILMVSAKRKEKTLSYKFIWTNIFDDVIAKYEDGVLKITATPFAPKGKVRKITLN